MLPKYKFDSSNTKTYTLKINADLLEKFKIVAKKEYRTTNRQLFYIIRKYVTEYERNNGEVEL